MLVLLIAGLSGLSACDRGGPAGPPPRDPVIARDSPEAATRSLLTLLEAQCRAGARRDHATIQTAREQIAWHLAAREALVRDQLSEDRKQKLLLALAGNWAAMILYYADGLGRDALARLPGPDPTSAVVVVPLTAPGDTAQLVVTCVQGPDHEWRIQGLRFAPPGKPAAPAVPPPATAPAVPATTPAPAPATG